MRRKARKGGGKQQELTIESLGGRGDGVAGEAEQPVFVPFALPGERVRVKLAGRSRAGVRGELLEILSESPDRVAPPCPHFGPCGGCSVQHLDDVAYRRWTREQVVAGLTRRGFADPPVAEPVFIGARTRRRATLAARHRKSGVVLGFHGRESHVIEDIQTCQVLTPGLMAILPPLRAALARVLDDSELADVSLLESETGIAVLLASKTPPGLRAREALAGLAETCDLAGVFWHEAGAGDTGMPPEPVAVRRPAILHFGAIPVEPPPGGFVQPTQAGERVLIDAVTDWLGEGAGRVADLYAGVGTFTFPLSATRRVHAVEGDQAAMAALWRAARKNDRAGRVTAEVRDLASDPLTPDDLKAFNGVIFDPPRTGAKAQAQALAASSVQTVAAVSCNPNTFGRDARILADGGYRLIDIRPVDQFPWTGHVELVACFRR